MAHPSKSRPSPQPHRPSKPHAALWQKPGTPRSEIERHLAEEHATFDYGGQTYRFQHLGVFVGSGPSILPETDTPLPVILVRAGEHSTALVTDDDESGEAEPLTALHHLGDAVDVDELVDELAVPLFTVVTVLAVTALRTFLSHLYPPSFAGD